jgi:DNA-binding NarL/FixJ family response regulator
MPKSVLIVDDNHSIRFLLRSLIESAGFAVCAEAENGEDGIAKAQQTMPDLILLDFSMPRMNGAEATVVLKALMPRVPIILFTLHEEIIGRRLGKAAPDLIISKIDAGRMLLDGINSLLGSAHTSPAALAGFSTSDVPNAPGSNQAKNEKPSQNM